MDKRVLIIMIGVPGSGKSTIANQISNSYDIPVVSSDRVRFHLYGSELIQGDYNEVFDEVYRQINEQIEHGICIYDATNTKRKWRYNAIAKTLPSEVVYVIVNPGLKKALYQNKNRERHCPEYVIQRMYRQLISEYPKENEYHNLKIFTSKQELIDYLEECKNNDF